MHGSKHFPHAGRFISCRGWIVLVLYFLLVAVSLGPSVLAQEKKSPPEAQPNLAEKIAAPSSGHELTAADVEAFMDGMVPVQISRDDIAGAVVAVVKDGKLLFSKGYGYADVAKKRPVTPDSTLFRVGSISKLFTWTSVMQQVELGKMSLDGDVNSYIDYKIPATFPQPITVKNLMTHTPGFEEAIKELFVADASGMIPLDEYLKSNLPRRLFPPGQIPAYSNYGAALAGYIVQRVSGEPFDDYVARHIFAPLGMEHATFVQPLPASLAPMMSEGYETASGGAKEFEYVEAWPAGSLAVTADDISRFMIAHLQNGELDGKEILSPAMAQIMHAWQFSVDPNPEMHAVCLGFYEESRNGHRIIGHAGDTQYFHSDLHLILDSNVGFFVSYNSAGKGTTSDRSELFRGFLDRYFPYAPVPAPIAASARNDARRVTGSYLISRRSDDSLFRLLSVLGDLKVTANSDGTIESDAFKNPSGQPEIFEEVGSLQYREKDGQNRLDFITDKTGKLAAVMDFPVFIFQQVPFYLRSGFVIFVLVGALVVFALNILLWPVAAAARRHFERKLELSPAARRQRKVIRVVCVWNLVVALAWGLGLSGALQQIGSLNRHLDPRLHFLQVLWVVAIVGMLAGIYFALRTLVDNARWWGDRLACGVSALAFAGFFWVLWAFNFLNFHLQY
ncbi:MAG: serine hydrolase domain-containing protein [Candidatus Acidiferrales bacterium]